ncbi:MAG: ribonuclease PH [Myxococcales bacterium]|nr:ribonuclease PH [Myxococcota bacterium]MDW8281637.1 ribonuclease PH [Myxococcales bacterium]
MRADGRRAEEIRPVEIEPGYLRGPAGSAFIRCGATWVLCSASVGERVPAHVTRGGWLTAEYAMLPGSAAERVARGPSGRGKEIERLIGRSLRAALDLNRLPPLTLTIDCDVLQADGGTRTAAITGGYVALVLALRRLRAEGVLGDDPLRGPVAAVSAGLVGGTACLDLSYQEDAEAEVDMNFVMRRDDGALRFVEVQGTGERGSFDRSQLEALCELAARGIAQLMEAQARALACG